MTLTGTELHSKLGAILTVQDDNQKDFQDSDGPFDVALDPYTITTAQENNGFFELYTLNADSKNLGYLNNPIILTESTLIVGFNDNGSPTNGDSDFDDIIIAMQPLSEPTSTPTPEPAFQ